MLRYSSDSSTRHSSNRPGRMDCQHTLDMPKVAVELMYGEV